MYFLLTPDEVCAVITKWDISPTTSSRHTCFSSPIYITHLSFLGLLTIRKAVKKNSFFGKISQIWDMGGLSG